MDLTNALAVLDRAAEYVMKLEHFRASVEKQTKTCVDGGGTVHVEVGRKFDKVYVKLGDQMMGRYMVDRNSWDIYGVKSWAQVNTRRWFGTLDTVDQYHWENYHGEPRSGTVAEQVHLAREASITSTFKPRGRPRKGASS